MRDGVLITHNYTQRLDRMTETIKDQVNHVQSLTDNQKANSIRFTFMDTSI